MMCRTPYCLICQHDRVFRQSFTQLADVISMMDRNRSMRSVSVSGTTLENYEMLYAFKYPHISSL